MRDLTVPSGRPVCSEISLLRQTLEKDQAYPVRAARQEDCSWRPARLRRAVPHHMCPSISVSSGVEDGVSRLGQGHVRGAGGRCGRLRAIR